MEPKVGQIWRYRDHKDRYLYIFIAKITSNNHAVHYYPLSDPERLLWDYATSFTVSESYELVSG